MAHPSGNLRRLGLSLLPLLLPFRVGFSCHPDRGRFLPDEGPLFDASRLRDLAVSIPGAVLFAQLPHLKGAGLDVPLPRRISVLPPKLFLPVIQRAPFATKDLSSIAHFETLRVKLSATGSQESSPAGAA